MAEIVDTNLRKIEVLPDPFPCVLEVFQVTALALGGPSLGREHPIASLGDALEQFPDFLRDEHLLEFGFGSGLRASLVNGNQDDTPHVVDLPPLHAKDFGMPEARQEAQEQGIQDGPFQDVRRALNWKASGLRELRFPAGLHLRVPPEFDPVHGIQQKSEETGLFLVIHPDATFHLDVPAHALGQVLLEPHAVLHVPTEDPGEQGSQHGHGAIGLHGELRFRVPVRDVLVQLLEVRLLEAHDRFQLQFLGHVLPPLPLVLLAGRLGPQPLVHHLLEVFEEVRRQVLELPQGGLLWRPVGEGVQVVFHVQLDLLSLFPGRLGIPGVAVGTDPQPPRLVALDDDADPEHLGAGIVDLHPEPGALPVEVEPSLFLLRGAGHTFDEGLGDAVGLHGDSRSRCRKARGRPAGSIWGTV